MKMRYIVIVFTIFLGCAYFLVGRYNIENSYSAVNIPDLNEKYKIIEKAIHNNENIEPLERMYGCQVYMLDEEQYQEAVFAAIQKGCPILDYYSNGVITGKIIFQGQNENYEEYCQKIENQLKIFMIIFSLIGYGFLFFLYIRFIRPFQKLERFAINISKGNLDIPLQMKKSNYFGAFTESFDIMREELSKAREGEYQANLSKKELVASLSHDIKTPVSTIKALCEILMIKLKDTEHLEKIAVIDQKASMIDELISNMFHATLEDLEVLKIEPQEELSTLIKPMFDEINYSGMIHIENEIPSCLIYADKLRLNQVIDKIINNSYKYANTPIDIRFEQEKEGIRIWIRDRGEGISVDELPLITQKFYRGQNTKGQSGSGLGLYLSKLFMKGMYGEMECYCDHGFVVVLFLKRV
jgi:signal transduction histidine kinase